MKSPGLQDATRRHRERKRHGVHYTPPDLARFLAESIIAQWPDALCRESRAAGGHSLIHVLDPACGDGALLQALAAAFRPDLRKRLVLTGCETDPHASRRAEKSLHDSGVARVVIHRRDFLVDDAEPAEDDSRTFDVVIANPPYVRTQVLGAERARSLAKRFGLSGRVDLYQAFVQAIAGVLKPGGLLGLLTSNRFLTVKAGAAVRRLLRTEFDLRDIYDLGDTKLFSAAVLPAIVIASRRHPNSHSSPPGRFDRIYELRNDEPVVSHRPSVLAALADRGTTGVIETAEGTFCIERGDLAAATDLDDVWRLTHAAREHWLATLRARQDRTFGDVAEIRVGIKTTADRVFVRDNWNDLPPDLRPEPALLHPLLTHREAARWSVAEPGPIRQVLYPHVNRDGRRVPICLKEYPRAAKYLESHADQLRGRTYVAESGREWYEIWVPHDPAAWAGPKIVYPDIAESPRFFLDRSGAIVQGDCYWITLRPDVDPDWLPLILAVANSTLATEFYDVLFHNKLYAGRRRFMTQYVRQFPLPSLGSKIANEIISLVEQLTGRQTAAGPVEDRLDHLVRQAFGLSE